MRTLSLQEANSIAGGDAGDIKCSIGVPSGAKCEGSLSDIGDLVATVWNFLADIPGTMPYVTEKILEKI